jgi:hypothetical protein
VFAQAEQATTDLARHRQAAIVSQARVTADAAESCAAGENRYSRMPSTAERCFAR